MIKKSRPEQLADAYERVAQANHYMVGIIGPITEEERNLAEQILIARQNSGPQVGAIFARRNLALDILAHDAKLADQRETEIRRLREILRKLDPDHAILKTEEPVDAES